EQRYMPPYYFALIYAALGQSDQAFAYLEQALEAKDYWILWLAVEPRFDCLREDARFRSLLARIRPAAAALTRPMTVTAVLDEQTTTSRQQHPFSMTVEMEQAQNGSAPTTQVISKMASSPAHEPATSFQLESDTVRSSRFSWRAVIAFGAVMLIGLV